MRIRLLPLVLCLLLLAGGCGTRLDNQSPFLKYRNEASLSKINGLLSAFQSKNGLVGMSVGILKGDQVHFFNYGSTGGGGSAVSEDTLFELGRVTEIFTGHVFGEYIFRGYLQPDTPITNYFPYLTLPVWEDGSAPTNQEVATHRGGFEVLPDNLGEDPDGGYDELALRRYLSRASLPNKPGTVYDAEGMDYGILGFLMKTVLKQNYEYLIKYSIMYRIGMTNTTLTLTEAQEAALALPHDAQGHVTDFGTYEALAGMGGFKSTAYDLINYASVHMNRFPIAQADWEDLASEAEEGSVRRKALTRLTVEQRMTAALSVATALQYSEDGVSIGYGYHLGQMNAEHYVWQAGTSEGYAAYFGVVPGTETAVVILANGPAEVQAMGEEILAFLQS